MNPDEPTTPPPQPGATITPTEPTSEAPQPAAQPAPQPTPLTTTTPVSQPVTPDTSTLFAPDPQPVGGAKAPKSKKKFAPIAIIIAVAIVLLGGSAGAYLGVIVPNKPANKLAKAFSNLAGQKQVTMSGSIDYEDKNSTSSNKGMAIDYTAKIDTEKTQASIAGDIGVSGTKFPFEARYIDKDIYAKVSGMSGIGAVLGDYATTADAAAYGNLLKGIDNQWYVIDRSVLQSAGTSTTCVADLSFALNKDDVNKIEAAFKKYPLFTIKNSSSETLSGVQTTKYELAASSDATAKNFLHELNSLSVVKKVKDCVGDSHDVTKAEDTVADEVDNTGEKVYAWIGPGKQMKKLEVSTTDDSSSFKMSMNFDYKAFEITKPDGAKSIQDLLSDVLGSSASGSELTTLLQ